jgi:tetratricopeptide (TPR) repeat protein
MLRKGMSKSEIEKELAGKGEFVQIDYLTAFLREEMPTDVRKFVMLRAAEIYGKKMMFGEAAKIYNNLAMLTITFKEKIQYYIKEAEMHIKGGNLREADRATSKAMNEANTFEKNDIMFNIRQFYRKQAEAFEKEIRRANAARMYEKLLELSATEAEKREYRGKLMALYEKLGKFREYNALKGTGGK